MYRGRVFIGDGSPITLRYYTVMPPNNYIPGIFPGYNRIFTSFGKLHPSLFCPLGPLQPIGPITRFPARLSKRSLFDAFPSGLRLRSRRPDFRRRCFGLRLSPLLFVFACGQPVFAVGVSVFASLRFSSSSPSPCGEPVLAAGAPVFATLRFSSSSPVANWSSPQAPRSSPEAWRRPCRCSQIARGPSIDGRRWHPQQ